MSYEWESSYDQTPVEFNVYDVRDEQQANALIAERLEAIKKLHNEVLEIAERFRIRVQYELESDVIRGHNRAPEIYWNPSSQHC